MVSNSEAQAQDRARSYRNLQHAGDAASANADYDSHETTTRIHALFRERFGSDAREWQVDVTEALLLGLDYFVVVGTGGGRTMPFMMPMMRSYEQIHHPFSFENSSIGSDISLLEDGHYHGKWRYME